MPCALTILSLVTIALAVPAPSPIVTVRSPRRSIGKRDNGQVDAIQILGAINATLAKYHGVPLPYYPELAQRQAETGFQRRNTLRLTDDILVEAPGAVIDNSYYGPVTIGAGHNAQTFQLIFDTGSSDVWVPGPDCTLANGCNGTGVKYNQLGTNLHRQTNLSYASGTTGGNDYSDVVEVAGLTARNQVLISATEATGFSSDPFDGVLGLAFPSAAGTKSPPFFQTILEQHKSLVPELSFFLGRDVSNTEGYSEVTLGGRDYTKFRGVGTMVPVTTEHYWQVKVDDVRIKHKAVANTTGQAAIDTGTALLIAPKAAASAIFESIPTAEALDLGTTTLFAYNCTVMTADFVPSFTFAGRPFPMSLLDFNLGTLDEVLLELVANADTTQSPQLLGGNASQICISTIWGVDIASPVDGTLLYVVGDVFLKSWYTTFSYIANWGKPAVVFAQPTI